MKPCVVQVRMQGVAVVAAMALVVSVRTGSAVPVLSTWKLNTTGLTGYNGLPADVQRLRYSTGSVYVNASCIPDYSIGPWPGNPERSDQSELPHAHLADAGREHRRLDLDPARRHRTVEERRRRIQRARRPLLPQPEHLASERDHRRRPVVRWVPRPSGARRRVSPSRERLVPLRRQPRRALRDPGLRLRWVPDLRALRACRDRRHGTHHAHALELCAPRHHRAAHAARRHGAVAGPVRPRRLEHVSARILRRGLPVRGRVG